MASVRYRNLDTEVVATFASHVRQLDRSDRWALVEDTPLQSASKDVWVTFAEARGYDPAEGLTKAEIVEQFG